MRHNDDEQMEKLLRQMPKIKDDRDPKQIYKEIQPKLINAPRRPKIIPAAALVAALILFALVGPMFFNNMQYDTSLSGSEGNRGSEESMDMDMAVMNTEETADDADSGADRSSKSLNEKEESSVDADENASQFAASEMSVEGKSFVVNSYNEAVEYAVTLGVSLKEADSFSHGGSTTTLTVVVPRNEKDTYIDALNKVRGDIPYEEYGISPPIINDNVTITEGDIGSGSPAPILDVTAMSKGLSSYQSILFSNELYDTFSHKYSQIIFSDNGSTEYVEIGSTVYEGPITFESKKRRAYYKYHTGSTPLLIAGHEQYKTIRDTLDAMTSAPEQADYSKLQPSIPDTVKVEGVTVEDGGRVARIKLSDGSVLENNEETIFALEAMLMVAKEFGLQGVVFVTSHSGTIGTITLNEEVSVPFSPNPIPYNQ